LHIQRSLWVLVSPFVLASIVLLAVGAPTWLEVASIAVMLALGLLVMRHYRKAR
jgi:ABC-type polysaccharide/polyol phosphate export permease